METEAQRIIIKEIKKAGKRLRKAAPEDELGELGYYLGLVRAYFALRPKDYQIKAVK